MPEGVEFLWMNPADLIVGANIRTNADITPEFRLSIRDLGVQTPFVAVRAPTAMTQADTAGAYEQLALLGLSAAQITKRTRRTKTQVVAGLTVAKSKAAAEATGQYALDLTSAALFAEFEGDEQATATLTDPAARGGVGGARRPARPRRADPHTGRQGRAGAPECRRREGDPPARLLRHRPARGRRAARQEPHPPPGCGRARDLPHHAAWVRYDPDTATAGAVYNYGYRPGRVMDGDPFYLYVYMVH
jgi:hypothetical protein